jgi:hypothetical protein
VCGVPTVAVSETNKTSPTKITWIADNEPIQACYSCKQKKMNKFDISSLTSLTEKSAHLFVKYMRTKFPEMRTEFPLNLTTSLISKWKDYPNCTMCGVPTVAVDPMDRTCPIRVVWTADKEHKQVCYSCKKKKRRKKKKKARIRLDIEV